MNHYDVPVIKWYPDSPDAGDPACLCSLCGMPIGEEEVPIRSPDRSGNLEARFHLPCFNDLVDCGAISAAGIRA